MSCFCPWKHSSRSQKNIWQDAPWMDREGSHPEARPLLRPGLGRWGCNTGHCVCGLHLCPQPAWGREGKSRWKLGEELLASSGQEARADHRLPCSPDLVALDWSLIPLPALGLAPLAWGRARALQPHSKTCFPAWHLSEDIRERERERSQQLLLPGGADKYGHSTGVGKKEKVDTADMSLPNILDKRFWWTLK